MGILKDLLNTLLENLGDQDNVGKLEIVFEEYHIKDEVKIKSLFNLMYGGNLITSPITHTESGFVASKDLQITIDGIKFLKDYCK